jgi:hypothetical protein
VVGKNMALVPANDPRGLLVAIEVAQDIVKKLSVKVPKNMTWTRAGPGGRQLTYIPWAYCCRVLNDTFGPDWSHTYSRADIEECELEPIPAKPARPGKPATPAVRRIEMAVTATLITPWGRHTATAGHLYYPSNGEQLKADAIQSAASKALTRAAARIGIGLDLRLHDREEDDLPAAQAAAAVATSDLFMDACGEYGLTEAQAIALLSETIAGDQNALPSLADVVAGGGYESTEEVVAALKAAIEAMTQEPVEEGPAPDGGRVPVAKAPPRKRAVKK